MAAKPRRPGTSRETGADRIVSRDLYRAQVHVIGTLVSAGQSDFLQRSRVCRKVYAVLFFRWSPSCLPYRINALQVVRQHVTIPAGASAIVVHGEYYQPFEWNTVFRCNIELESRQPSDADDKYTSFGYKTYGTVFNPEWNSNVEPWEPKFSGQVNVVNKTGERLYVGYCTDLKWGIANGGAGLVMALRDSIRTANPNAVRFFALALSVDRLCLGMCLSFSRKYRFRSMPVMDA